MKNRPRPMSLRQSSRRQLVARYLLAGWTGERIARRLGCSGRTIRNLIATPKFQAVFAELQQDLLSAVDKKLNKLLYSAMRTLHKLLAHPEWQARNEALQSILKLHGQTLERLIQLGKLDPTGPKSPLIDTPFDDLSEEQRVLARKLLESQRRSHGEMTHRASEAIRTPHDHPIEVLGRDKRRGLDQLLREVTRTSTMMGRAFFYMSGIFGEIEREMIVQRVRAGLDRARADGKILGRPRLSAEKVQQVREQLKLGQALTIRQVAKLTGVGSGTVHRIKAAEAADALQAQIKASDQARIKAARTRRRLREESKETRVAAGSSAKGATLTRVGALGE